MDAATWARLEALFFEASQLPTDEHAAFVARHCAGQFALRDELLTLLAAQDTTGGPLDQPPTFGLIDDEDDPNVLALDTRIGVWRVGNLIGRGGAGDVYFATRADGQFDQAVVLKILHRDGALDLARFHAERQILASLDHPSIARLVDGGVCSDGRLYAVIDYVAGVNLLEHCTQFRYDLRQRLSLFLQICEVMAYAHRNLVVHRDLKPSNILVTSDGRIKLLDFGVAKRLDAVAEASDSTSAPYTPDYAAPEQLTGLPVTTATDVYALGIILFELLTGARPWRMQGMPIARIVQQIVHRDAPIMSQLSIQSTAISTGQLKGDLDAIVATCLRKSATERYPTVDALRRDIEHHLHAEPVVARGRNQFYVLGRTARRYRWVAVGTLLLVGSLAVGLAATMWQARKVEVERDIARRAVAGRTAVIDQLTNLFRISASRRVDRVTGKTLLDSSAKNVFKEYKDNPQLLSRVVMAIADTYGVVEDMEGESAILEAYLAQSGANADHDGIALAEQQLAFCELMRGHTARAGELLNAAKKLWDSAPARYTEERTVWLQYYGMLQRERGDVGGSIDTLKNAIKERLALSGVRNGELSNLYNALGVTLMRANRLDEALAAYRATLAIDVDLGRSEEPDSLVTLANIGIVAYKIGHLREAEDALGSTIDKQKSRFGDSEALAIAMGNYGATLTALGRTQDALAVLRPALAMANTYAGEGSPMAICNSLFLIDALILAGQFADAAEVSARSETLAQQRFGKDGLITLRVRLAAAQIALAKGHAALAETDFKALVEPFVDNGSTATSYAANALVGAGESALAEGKLAEAISLLTRAVTLRETLKWGNDNWELAVTRSRLGEALLQAQRPGGTDLLRQALPVLTSQLGAQHPHVVRVRRALAL